MILNEIKRLNRECPVCEVEKDLIYGEINEVLKVRGEDIDVTSRVYYCTEGDHYFHEADDEEEKFQVAYREYRKRKGLLQPDEIKQIREQYGLSQRSFAQLLEWGEVTIHRYESGAIQDAVHNDVLSMIRSFEEFKKYFESKKAFIGAELSKRVAEKISAIENEKCRQTFDLISKSFRALRKPPISYSSLLNEDDFSRQDSDAQYDPNEGLALAA